MTLNRLVELGLKHGLCINEILLLYLLNTKDYTSNSLIRKYITKCGIFPENMLKHLEKSHFLENFNSPGEFLPEMYMLSDKARELFANEAIGEEFWNAYPAVFFMKDKGVNFIARAGGDKDYVISEYLKRIGYSMEQHKDVLKQIEKYRGLVARGLINGYKIIDFVKSEIWNVISEIEDNKDKTFGRDL